MLHQVLVLLIVLDIDEPVQLLLDLPVSLNLITYLLHTVVYFTHIVRSHPLTLLTTVRSYRLGEVLGVALVGSLGV